MSRLMALILLAAATASSSLADTGPSVEALVESIQRHHPEYLGVLARTDGAAAEREIADAAFDLRLGQQTRLRPSGYYDGSYAHQSVSKPLAAMGAEITGAYRISDGEFPVYEAENSTLDLGEASIGVRLSLLRDRDIDQRRAAQLSAAWRYAEAQSRQTAALNQLLYSGVSAYLNWYQSHRKQAVIADLVDLTRDRLQGIQSRVDSGDLAEFDLTEYRSALLRRELLAQEASRNVALDRQRLAYFWRGDDGTGQTANWTLPPSDIGWRYRPATLSEAHFAEAIDAHPGVTAMQAELEQIRNRQRLARNETLPQLDLEMKVARDLGEGMATHAGTESMVGLSFSVPVGQRAARAREAVANAELRALTYDIRALKEQLRRDVSISLEGLRYSRSILELSREQERLAESLLQQERTRFEAGVSDQFLLINRETAALEAHLRTIDAELGLLRQELLLHTTLAQLGTPITDPVS